jgi:amino acid permease
MKNYGSISLDHRGGNPHPQDHLVPPFFFSNQDEEANSTTTSNSERPSSLLVGTFNLIATILGGGVLTLPIAFQKCGVAFTSLFMLVSAYMTYMSLMMLCYSSRRSGASSFGEVVRSAYGEKAEVGVNVILFVYISFVVAAFMVLIRDIWTPLVGMSLGKTVDDEGNSGVSGDQVLVGFMIFLLPFLFQRTLHALKWNCYIGFASIIILCSALVRGGFQRQHNLHPAEDDDNVYNIDWFKVPPAQDALFAFPIVMLAFLCQFNVLSIQNTLQRPTRRRMSHIVGMSVGASVILMYLFGLGGYMMYGSSIQGNVLLNISVDKSDYADESLYWLFLLGRIGCGTTLVLALPLVSRNNVYIFLASMWCETSYSTAAFLLLQCIRVSCLVEMPF